MCLKISDSLLGQLRREAERALPNECCGLLLGREGRVTDLLPTGNIHPSPRTHFEIDPQALIDAHRAARQGGLELIGYYHSHPHGPARPSDTDQEMAHGDGLVWAIVGRDEITAWRDEKSGFRQLHWR